MDIDEWKNIYLTNNKSGYYSREKVIKQYETVYDIINNFSNAETFVEKCYRYVHNITTTPKCASETCNNKVIFKNATIGYQKYCSVKCGTHNSYTERESTLLERYGVKHPSQIKKNILKRIDKRKINVQNIIGKDAILLDYIWDGTSNRINDVLKIKCDKCDKIHEIPNKVFEQRIQLNLDWRSCITKYLNGTSNGEKELYNFIKDNYNGNIILNDRKILRGQELDIYLPNMNLAFEFNGLYWHSELFKDNLYHYNKWKKCKDLNITLIQIYEDEWSYKQDIVKSRILNLLKKSNRIFARKCIIKKIDFGIVKKFLNINHLQGSINSSINFGLYYNNELVSVMTFGKPRKAIGRNNSSKGDYELYRFCNKLNTTVVGGASKLFKHFIKNYTFNNVYSYSSLEWPGTLYEKLNMKLDRINKSTYWFFSNDKRISRHNFNKHNLTKLNFKNLKEAKLKLSMYEIHGAGTYKFVYSK